MSLRTPAVHFDVKGRKERSLPRSALLRTPRRGGAAQSHSLQLRTGVLSLHLYGHGRHAISLIVHSSGYVPRPIIH